MNLENISIGPRNVYIAGSSIGATKGGVSLAIGYTTKDTDALGEHPNYDLLLELTKVEVGINFAETTLETLSHSMPWLSLQTSGTKKLIELTSDPIRLRSYAVEIKLEPLVFESDNELITIHKAVPISVEPLSYKNSEELVYKVKFQALCLSSTDSTLISFGDTTVI